MPESRVLQAVTSLRLPQWSRALMLTLATGLTACRGEASASVEVIAGRLPEQRVTFSPKTSFAEYLELRDRRGELEITLASYERSCESYVPPPSGGTSVMVVVTTPPGTTPTPGDYPWAPNSKPEGEEPTPEHPVAIPKVFMGQKSYLFQPGGGLRLTQAVLDHEGVIEGMLAFEFAGTVEHPATSIKGKFRAKLCRVDRPKIR